MPDLRMTTPPKLPIGAPVKYTPLNGDDRDPTFLEATEIYVEAASLLDEDTMLFSCLLPGDGWKLGQAGPVRSFTLLPL
jgi:hypothetical protein